MPHGTPSRQWKRSSTTRQLREGLEPAFERKVGAGGGIRTRVFCIVMVPAHGPHDGPCRLRSAWSTQASPTRFTLHEAAESAISVLCLAPIHFRRMMPPLAGLSSQLLRTVERMAASKPTSYLSKASHFLLTLSIDLGTLICDLGCIPCDDEALPSPSHCRRFHGGIRSLLGRPTQKGTASLSVLYPHRYSPTLPLKAFRGEPAITRLDKLITPNLKSSQDIAPSTGSVLLPTFVGIQPAQG